MKPLFLILLATAALLFTTQAPASTAGGDSKTVKLKVTGMTCGGCSSRIHNALKKKEGIIDDEVEYPSDLAVVKYDPDKITEEEIIKVIKKAGFTAVVIKDKESEKPDIKLN